MNQEALFGLLRKSTAWQAYDREAQSALSHAYLVLSDDPMAADAFLRMMCMRAYCPTACGKCAECKKVLSNNKLDIMQPNPNGELLAVKQVQDLVEDAMMGSYEGGKKIYVLRAMHLQPERVQNKLLKTLEEPNENVLFLLCADTDSGILPTIRSRVKKLSLAPFDTQDVERLLQNEGIEGAAVFARTTAGNVTLALKLGADEDYFGTVDEVADMLRQLQSSTQIPLYLYESMFAKEHIGTTLDVMEIAVKDLLYAKNNLWDEVVYQSKSDAYRQTVTHFPLRSLPMVLELIDEAKQKIAARCSSVNVADSLLLKILEVKSLCAR